MIPKEVWEPLGFKSEEELNNLVARADLSTPEKFAAFKKWQKDDGSKAGLLKLREKEHVDGDDSPTA